MVLVATEDFLRPVLIGSLLFQVCFHWLKVISSATVVRRSSFQLSVEDIQGITSVSFGFGFTTTCDLLSSLTGELLVWFWF